MGELTKTDDVETIKVTYDDHKDTIEKVYEKLLHWFVAHDAYSGEIIYQSDSCMIAAPELLSELAEDVFRFDIDYEYDDEEDTDE